MKGDWRASSNYIFAESCWTSPQTDGRTERVERKRASDNYHLASFIDQWWDEDEKEQVIITRRLFCLIRDSYSSQSFSFFFSFLSFLLWWASYFKFHLFCFLSIQQLFLFPHSCFLLRSLVRSLVRSFCWGARASKRDEYLIKLETETGNPDC